MSDIEISGAECVLALILGGFKVRRRAPGSTVLERGPHVVIVPDSLVLAPNVLEAILSDAELTHETFLELVSEEPTMPDVAAQLRNRRTG
jgi:hypothetical protein